MIKDMIIKNDDSKSKAELLHLKPHPFTAKRKQERRHFSTSSSLSKFEVPVVMNLKHIFELLGLDSTCFLI